MNYFHRSIANLRFLSIKMGCSPSKGQLFAGVSSQKALLPGSQENDQIQSKTETDFVSAELTILEENTPIPLQGNGSSLIDVVCDTPTIVGDNVDVEANVELQEGLMAQDTAVRKDVRKKKNKGAKRNRQKKEKERKTVPIQSKVDLPELMVKAHQAAYAYLNPNISKYESLLGLLDQATQTQLSLQPMTALLALRYEEMNQALEEMAVEGEQLLEEHGSNMAWPAALRNASFIPTKADAELDSPEPSPHLLQQMLQHSTEKLSLVGDSVKGLGDAALEEASDYFASVAQLLREKLMVKKAIEVRLKQVLGRVEAAALRKFSLEDSALHSEDSGIGADNESQNSSARLRRHRESSGSGASTGSSSGYPESTLPVQSHLNGVEEDRNDEDDEEDDDDDDEEDSDEDEEEQEQKPVLPSRKMLNSSQAETSMYALLNGRSANSNVKRTDQRTTSIKRPKTADNSSVPSQENPKLCRLRGPRRSQSADSLYCKVDGYTEKSLKYNQNPEYIKKALAEQDLSWARLRRHSSDGQNTARCYGLQYGSKGPFKATLLPSSPPAFAPTPPGRNAVKRLINTFSQGTQDKTTQKPFNRSMNVRGTQRGFLPVLDHSKGSVSTNGNNNNNSYSVDQRFSDRSEDVDVDSLPPPPPEVLLDNSFESNESPTGREVTQRQRCGASQRLRASLQTVTVLPSRASVPRRSLSISPARPTRQDAVVGSRPGQEGDQPFGVDAEKDKATNLYQQSRKIIHLHHSSDSSSKTDSGNHGIIRAGSVVRQGSKETRENDALTPYPNSYPPTTPPVSRARLPPSCPSVRHRVPSPPALPPSPACGQWVVSTTSSSPSVQRWSRRSSDEENDTNSFSFYDARSVFCQDSQSLRPSCRSTLPRPWGEPSRGRLQTTSLPQTRPDVRPTLADQQQLTLSLRRDSASVNEVAQETPASCSDPDPQSEHGVIGALEAEPRQIMDKQD